jgi:putative NADH-flavin reductase
MSKPAIAPRRVAIFGGTGPTGRRLLAECLSAGHEVTALVRDPGALGERHERLRVLQGDALDAGAVERAVVRQDAVLSALGMRSLFRRSEVCEAGARHLLRAMEKHGVSRAILLSALGVGESRRAGAGWFFNTFIRTTLLRRPYDDKERMEREVRRSGLDWTLVRAPRLTHGPARGDYRASDDPGFRGSAISRADVAAFMAAQLGDERFIRRAVGVAY